MNKGISKKIIIGGCSLLLLGACGKTNFTPDDRTEESTSLASASQAQIKVNMQVYDNTNNIVYSDANSNSSLVLKANQNYNLMLSPSQDVDGLSYSLLLTKTSVVGATPQTIPLQSGSNAFSVPTQGDYSLKLVASAPKMLPLTKYYTANVTCANPTFIASSLDGSKLSVSPGSGSNIYIFNASAVASSANGMGPYTCAWDGTGVGIVDTAFKDCNSSSAPFYSNLVGDRNIAVLVKDACNTVHTVSKVMNLPFTVPGLGGNVFIHGQVNSATGTAANDARVDAAKYLATNSGGNNIVQSSYSGSSFSISAAKSYGMASSVAYGMKIQLSGLTGSVNLASMSSTLSAASAKIKTITYSTDQAGDAQGAVSFSGGATCTLSNQNVKVMFVQGTPCSDGSGSGNKATVEVWGNYTCTSLSNASGSISISGSFDGYDTLVDSCSGGGGGGGGVAPINL